jgi:hydrogenase maturation protease
MPFTVVGLGSEVAGDDAIGLALVEKVRERLESPRRVPLRAAASDDEPVACVLWPDADALTVAHDLLEMTGAVLLVDCADMGLAPGSARLLGAAEVRVKVKHSPVSVHGLGLAEALELARRLGFTQPVHFFAVQPYDLAPGTGLSAEMAARLPELVVDLEGAARRLAGEALSEGRGA